MDNWISVDDFYKPKQNQLCLVTYKYYGEPKLDIARWDGNLFCRHDQIAAYGNGVTHWHNLPEPPQ